jgi:hypothetical protein
MTIRNFNSIYSKQVTVVNSDLINEVSTSKWDNKFDGLTLFNSQVRVAKLLTVDGTLSASGAVTVGGATTLNNTLYGAGDATFGGTLAASGAVTVGGATTLNNTLYGAGAATFGGTLAASGAVTVGGGTTLKSTLYGAGAATFGGTLAASGAVTVGGGTTLKSTLYGAGNATFGGTLAASGAATFGSTLYAAGNISTSGNITAVNGAFSNATCGGTFTCNGVGNLAFGTLIATYGVGVAIAGSLRGPADFVIDPAAYNNETGNVTIRGNLLSNGTLAASGAVTVGGATTLKNTLYGAGAATFGSSLSASGAVAFGNTLSVTGDTTLSGALRGPAEFIIDPSQYNDETGTVVIRGNLRVQGETTTINSANLEVADRNIIISKNAVARSDSDEAGLSMDLGYVSGSTGPKNYATLNYQYNGDNFRVNKLVRCASGPVVPDDLTNKAYVDSLISSSVVNAGYSIAPNTIGFNVINGFKFKVIQRASDFNGVGRNDICLTENNILYIWNNGTTFSINLPYQGVGWSSTTPTENVLDQVVTVYNGINMFAYRVSKDVGENNWTNAA